MFWLTVERIVSGLAGEVAEEQQGLVLSPVIAWWMLEAESRPEAGLGCSPQRTTSSSSASHRDVPQPPRRPQQWEPVRDIHIQIKGASQAFQYFSLVRDLEDLSVNLWRKFSGGVLPLKLFLPFLCRTTSTALRYG